MAAIASLLIVLTMSLLVTRIAAMALMLTGVSREAAQFQARSAFSKPWQCHDWATPRGESPPGT